MAFQWKNNAPYAVCLTHDVDRTRKRLYHYGYYALRSPGVQIRSAFGKIRGTEPYWNFWRLAETEEKWGFHSTFLFLNETTWRPDPAFMGRYRIRNPKVQRAIRELQRNGFEIGLHGSFYSWRSLDLLRGEKEVLENITGRAVVSVRQHYLNFSERLTWNIHHALGLKYDSTLGYNDRPGEDFPALPYRTPEGMLEMPIMFMDTAPIKTDEEKRRLYRVCDQRAKRGGLIVLNFHQEHFQPLEYPQNVEVYETLIKKAFEDKAQVGGMEEIGAWCDGILS